MSIPQPVTSNRFPRHITPPLRASSHPIPFFYSSRLWANCALLTVRTSDGQASIVSPTLPIPKLSSSRDSSSRITTSLRLFPPFLPSCLSLTPWASCALLVPVLSMSTRQLSIVTSAESSARYSPSRPLPAYSTALPPFFPSDGYCRLYPALDKLRPLTIPISGATPRLISRRPQLRQRQDLNPHRRRSIQKE